MSNSKDGVDKDFFLENFEKLYLKIEQLTDEISKMKSIMDKTYKMNRSFGLKAIRNSTALDFAKDVYGIGSPTKRYILSIRAVTEEWKGRKNDILITIRQQEKETIQDLKSLGIRIPINDIKNISLLTKEVLSLLYVACELKNIDVNDLLREMLQEINKNAPSMVEEIKKKMVF